MKIKDIILAIVSIIPLALCNTGYGAEKPIIIAVVDTGYKHVNGVPDVQLCKFGHADFYGKNSAIGQVPEDKHGHGTIIAHIINDDLVQNGLTNFCLVIIKFTDGAKIIKDENVLKPVRYLSKFKNVAVINYSASGDYANDEEKYYLVSMLNRGVKIFAAAGNDRIELKNKKTEDEGNWYAAARKELGTRDRVTESYPAMYDKRINIVGALRGPIRWGQSNYGELVTQWEEGLYEFNKGKTIGSSNSCAVATRKYVKTMLLKKQNDSF